MVSENRARTLWVVVKVESGIPVIAEGYLDRQSAVMREHYFREHMHPENDETAVFQIRVSNAA